MPYLETPDTTHLTADSPVPRFRIGRSTAVATFGSCFAQQLGLELRRAEALLLDADPVPRGMAPAIARRRGYGAFSARTGEIPTARQLRQLLGDVLAPACDPRLVWRLPDGGHVDALRPAVDPDGMATVAEVLDQRRDHLVRLRNMLARVEVLVFTLGQSAAWEDRATGRALPWRPGAIAGCFDAEQHRLRRFSQSEVLQDLHAIHCALGWINPAIKLLLTVSPLRHDAAPLGKLDLRAAAIDAVAALPGTDYFPAYEIVVSANPGTPEVDAVSPEAAERAMSRFFAMHRLVRTSPHAAARRGGVDPMPGRPETMSARGPRPLR